MFEAARRFIDHVADPGASFTSEQRLGIAQHARAARRCALCARRKQAVSPYAVAGGHDSEPGLPTPVIDAVHRVATDSGRLTSRWHADLREAGVTDAELVEIAAITAGTAGADTLARASARNGLRLPEPQPGPPTGHIAQNATVHSARVPTVKPNSATGAVAVLYSRSPTIVPNIWRSLSLVPDDAIAFFEFLDHLYESALEQLGDQCSITRYQMELIAATVSTHNDCFY